MLTEGHAVLAETGDSWFNCQKLRLPRGCLYEYAPELLDCSPGRCLSCCDRHLPVLLPVHQPTVSLHKRSCRPSLLADDHLCVSERLHAVQVPGMRGQRALSAHRAYSNTLSRLMCTCCNAGHAPTQ